MKPNSPNKSEEISALEASNVIPESAPFYEKPMAIYERPSLVRNPLRGYALTAVGSYGVTDDPNSTPAPGGNIG